MKKEELYFQDSPITEVADLVYDLGQRIRKEFDEPIFGEFLITQALQYRTGNFKVQYQQILELAELFKESEESQNFDDLITDFTNGEVH